MVNVHGADMHDGRIGFWMDLIEGETLAEILSRGRLSPGEPSLMGQEINGAFNVRWYPNGFTDDEFGVQEPRLHDIDRPSETLWGFSVGYLW